MDGFSQEWRLLQQQHERYEFAALALKLAAVGLLAVNAAFVIPLLGVLWLQEAILKTFQSRLGARLLLVEQGLREGHGQAMQLHSDWQAARPRGLGLLREYALSACRPTVVFPYPVLMALAWLYS